MTKLQALIDAINITRQARGEDPLDVTAADVTDEILAAVNGQAPAAAQSKKKLKE